MRIVRQGFRSGTRAARTTAAMVLCMGSLTGCQDLTAKLPAGYIDPALYRTPEAAVQMAHRVRFEFQKSLMEFMLNAGLVADEFYANIASDSRVIGHYSRGIVLDSRYFPDYTSPNATPLPNATDVGMNIDGLSTYPEMQRIRGQGTLARGFLRTYAPDSTSALQGELAAYEAFAEIMLADLYCSGVPLSVLKFEGDFDYRFGSRTDEVYAHAITLFDTALALAGSDARVRPLAQLGKGRALLALGRYAEAASAVAEVPDGYSFDLPLMFAAGTAAIPSGLSWTSTSQFGIPSRGLIADVEGGNGLDFLSAEDPRVKTQPYTSGGVTTAIPAAQTRIVVAHAVEARLIEAEAKLADNNPQWLDLLNTLRTVTGGVPDLPPLTDPGLETLPSGKTAHDVRVDLLFRERAFWLFFRGIRQGDLRRLIRHYSRTVDTVYPSGAYPAGTGFFNDFVDLPFPRSELPNPYFTGCFERGA